MSDWIKWAGGACPVHADTLVQVELCDGRFGAASGVPAGGLSWTKFGTLGDIAAYRVVGEAEGPGRTEPTPSTTALDVQVGGNHYKDMPIQPVQFIHANALGYFEGNVIKYVSRWRKKNGVADLEKARHYIDLLIDLESKHADRRTTASAD